MSCFIVLSEASEIEFIRLVVDYFRNGLEVIRPFNRKILVDPCFGFSKNRAQNQLLLKHFKTFLFQLDLDIPVVYGVSDEKIQ